MKAETDDESGEQTATMLTPPKNLFARFAFDASRGKSQMEKSSSLATRSTLGKRKAEVDEQEVASLKIGRKTAGKISASPKKYGSSSSSKVKLYDHLSEIDDNLEAGLDIVFCGINPGQQSAEIGHHYGNPNNHFWSCLHESGLTSRRLDPREDASLPREFSIGLTNLVDRPTAQQNELSKTEQVAGVSKLLEKVAFYKPRVLCFVGLGIADIVRFSVPPIANPGARGSKAKRASLKAAVGLQTYKMVHSTDDVNVQETLFFAVSSTSGRVVRYQKADKVKQFQDLRHFVAKLKEGTFDTTQITAIPPPAHLNLYSDVTEVTKTEVV